MAKDRAGHVAVAGVAGPDGPVPEAVQSRRFTLTALIGATIITAVLHIGQDIFLPLAVAMLITFALSPVVSLLRRRGLPHLVAVLGAVTVTFAAIGLFVMIVVGQLGQLAQQLPTFQTNIMAKIDTLRQSGSENGIAARLSGVMTAINSEIGAALPAEGSAAPAQPTPDHPMPVQVIEPSNALGTLTNLVMPLVGPVGTAGLVIVVVIFMLLERDELRDRFIRLVGSNDINRTTQVLEEAGGRVAYYLLMQLLVNLIYAVPIGLGLWLIGVPNALLWGLLTLVLRFVPYIGSVLAAAFPLFLAFAVSPDWSAVLWTAALFLVVELITSNIIEPWFYGSRTGVSALAIIVSAIFWTWVWGPLGLVLSTPLTVCLVVLGRHVPQFEVFDVLFGDRPVLAAHARLYQRLLVGDVVESTHRAGEALEEGWIVDYTRDVSLPALMLAQADYERGVLTQAHEDRFAAAALAFVAELDPIVAEEQEEARTESGEPLPGEGRRVLFVGGRSFLDDVAARMMAQAARADGADALWLPHEDLAASRFDVITGAGAQAIVLGYLDLAPLRGSLLQVRRLKRALPGVRIGVALWQAPEALADGLAGDGGTLLSARRVEAAKLEEIRALGADFVVTSPEAALDAVFADVPVLPLPGTAEKKASRKPARRRVPAAAE